MPVRKQRLVWTFTALVFLAGALIFVGRAHAETIGFSIEENSGDGKEISVTVLDDVTLSPIEDAEVVVGQLSSGILGGAGERTSRTEGNGTAIFAIESAGPAGLSQGLQSVTVSKAGYSTLSVVGVGSGEVTVYLKPLMVSEKETLASGNLSGFMPPFNRDTVHLGLVIKSLSAMDLLFFNVNSFFSPLKDSIEVFGRREIPSNIVLPRQDIWVFFSRVTLDKPLYRLPLSPLRPVRLAGMQGTIKVSDLLAVAQGGINAEFLNKVNFLRVGVTSLLDTATDFRKNFDSNVSLSANQFDVKVEKPPFAADVIVASLTDVQGDRQVLVPTDIKTAASASNPGNIRAVKLTAAPASPKTIRSVVAVAVAPGGKQISGIAVDQPGGVVRPGPFMPVGAASDVRSLPEVVKVEAPARGIGTVIFQAVSQSTLYPVWTVHVLPSAGEVEIPTRKVDPRAAIRRYSVAAFEMGEGFDEGRIDGGTVMRMLERFGQASTDIQE